MRPLRPLRVINGVCALVFGATLGAVDSPDSEAGASVDVAAGGALDGSAAATEGSADAAEGSSAAAESVDVEALAATAALAELQDELRREVERAQLRMRIASQIVEDSLHAAQVQSVTTVAAERVTAALLPATFRVESEARQRALLAAATHAASDSARVGVERGRMTAWTTLVNRRLESEAAAATRREEARIASLATAEAAVAIAHDPETPSSPDDDYTEIVRLLGEARVELRAGLDTFDNDSRMPSPLRRPIPDELVTGYATEFEAYQTAGQARDNFAFGERAARRQNIDDAASLVLRLNEARLSLLAKLSPQAREQVLGLSRVGIAQMTRELQHLGLMARWYRHDRASWFGDIQHWFVETLGIASSRYTFFRIVILLVVAFVLFRRRERVLDAIERWLSHRSTDHALPHWWPPTRGTLVDVGVLLVSWYGFGELVSIDPAAEFHLAQRVVVAVAIYRVILTATHQTLLWAAASAFVPVTQSVSQRMLRSLRVMGRYAMAVSVYLIVAETLLGRGYLYRMVLQTAWLGAFPIAWWLLRHWSSDVLDLYMRKLPNGLLIDAVKRVRGTMLQSALTIPAALPLLMQALTAWARATAYRFERSRRALSYLFLRSLERRAAAQESDSPSLELSPEVCTQLNSPITAAEVATVWPSQSGRVVAQFETWRTGRQVGSVAIVGERGIGKSAFVQYLCSELSEIPVTSVALRMRSSQSRDIVEQLSATLGAGSAGSASELVAALLSGERRVVVVDDTHRTFRRVADGLEGYDTLRDIVSQTCHHVFWICCYGAFAWRWIEYATVQRHAHALVVRLPAWPDRDITRLIRERMGRLGLVEVYDDLLDRKLAGDAREMQLAETRESFFRVVRDYADGIPAAALQVWVDALRLGEDGSIRVRTIDPWAADDLEALDDDSRFVVGAVVSQIDLERAALPLVLRIPVARCERAVATLLARGVLSERDGCVRITDPWQRAAVAFARRKNFIGPG